MKNLCFQQELIDAMKAMVMLGYSDDKIRLELASYEQRLRNG